MNASKRWTDSAQAAADRHVLSADERAQAELVACASFNGVSIVTVNDVLAVVQRRHALAVAS